MSIRQVGILNIFRSPVCPWMSGKAAAPGRLSPAVGGLAYLVRE